MVCAVQSVAAPRAHGDRGYGPVASNRSGAGPFVPTPARYAYLYVLRSILGSDRYVIYGFKRRDKLSAPPRSRFCLELWWVAAVCLVGNHHRLRRSVRCPHDLFYLSLSKVQNHSTTFAIVFATGYLCCRPPYHEHIQFLQLELSS